MWLKRTDGQPSSSFTFVVIGFTIVSLWLLLSIFTQVLGLEIREFSGTEAMAYLSPFLAYAWGRKWQEGRSGASISVQPVEMAKKNILTDEEDDERLVENGD